MVHNMNALVETAGHDLTVDETTWANGGYTDIHGRIIGKPCVTKGGQHTIIVDLRHRFVYTYTPCHKFFTNPAGFTAEGPAKVHCLFHNIAPIIKTITQDIDNKRSQIFKCEPCVSMDNHFSSDNVLQLLGKAGWGGIFTCRRDHLPSTCKKSSFHNLKNVNIDAQSKAALLSSKWIIQNQVARNLTP